MTVPMGWPGGEVNILAWSMPEQPRRGEKRTYCRVRVTHRATGVSTMAHGRDHRYALAQALERNRRLVKAYRALELI